MLLLVDRACSPSIQGGDSVWALMGAYGRLFRNPAKQLFAETANGLVVLLPQRNERDVLRVVDDVRNEVAWTLSMRQDSPDFVPQGEQTKCPSSVET